MSIWLGHRVLRYWIKHYSGSLGRVFCVRLALKPVDQVKQITLPDWNESNQLKAWMNKNVELGGNSSAWWHLSWNTGFSLPLPLNWSLVLLGLRSAGLQSRTTISSPGSLTLHLDWKYIPPLSNFLSPPENPGTCSPHNHLSQLLVINESIFVSVSDWFCVSGEPWLIQLHYSFFSCFVFLK